MASLAALSCAFHLVANTPQEGDVAMAKQSPEFAAGVGEHDAGYILRVSHSHPYFPCDMLPRFSESTVLD